MFKQPDFRENVNALSVLPIHPYVIFPTDGHACAFFGEKSIFSIIDTLSINCIVKMKNK